MNLGVGGALRTKNRSGDDHCRKKKERRDSFQEHLLNRRLRPDSYFTASGRIFRVDRRFEVRRDSQQSIEI